jgi:hypothetical protein
MATLPRHTRRKSGFHSGSHDLRQRLNPDDQRLDHSLWLFRNECVAGAGNDRNCYAVAELVFQLQKSQRSNVRVRCTQVGSLYSRI